MSIKASQDVRTGCELRYGRWPELPGTSAQARLAILPAALRRKDAARAVKRIGRSRRARPARRLVPSGRRRHRRRSVKRRPGAKNALASPSRSAMVTRACALVREGISLSTEISAGKYALQPRRPAAGIAESGKEDVADAAGREPRKFQLKQAPFLPSSAVMALLYLRPL